MLPWFDCIVLCVVLWFKCTYVCYLVGLERVGTVTVESYLGNLSNRVELWRGSVVSQK